MFSSLNEAWEHDPVKDMTNKLNQCTIQKCTKQMDDQSDIYRFSDNSPRRELNPQGINRKSLADPSKKSKRKFFDESLHLSDESLNIISEKPRKKRKSDLSFLNSDHLTEDSECAINIDHLKKCAHCYSKIKKLIDEKASKKNIISDSWKETLIIISGAIIALV